MRCVIQVAMNERCTEPAVPGNEFCAVHIPHVCMTPYCDSDPVEGSSYCPAHGGRPHAAAP